MHISESTRKLSRSWLLTAKYVCPGERCTLLTQNPGRIASPAPRPPSPPSRLALLPRRASSQDSLSRQSRQLGAKYDKLSRIPASDGVEKYLLPERARRARPTPPVGVSLYRPIPNAFDRLSQTHSRKGFYPSAFLFGSARTRLFAGQRYLHKSAKQSLFIFRESMARIYTRRPVCT